MGRGGSGRRRGRQATGGREVGRGERAEEEGCRWGVGGRRGRQLWDIGELADGRSHTSRRPVVEQGHRRGGGDGDGEES
jgi:hypothetical protein